MARIVPFRGILYNPKKIADLKEVITPPYDIISEKEQQEYLERHPQNMIRLILGKECPQDTEYDNRYTRAAEFFHGWLEQGILIQDTEPVFYVTEIDYSVEGVLHTRFGLIVLVELEDFEKEGIRPHEKTFSTTKADRLRLMEACKANFSPVFSLFSDPGEEIAGTLRAGIEGIAPDFEFDDPMGYRHRLWRVSDRKIHTKIGKGLAGKPLYIADGHHRYETALNYRARIMSKHGPLAPDDPCNFVMMYLSSMNEAGLTIRPVHRLLCDVPGEAMDGFVAKARASFDVETLRFEGLDRKGFEAAFLAKIRAGAKVAAIGAVVGGHSAFYILRVKEGIMDRLFEGEIPAPLRKLDVTVATKLVLQQILGFSGAALDDEQRILYTSRHERAFEAVNVGECDIALILNPTRLGQIQEVSDAGLIMPRKSTYFYPKVMTGLVINKIDGFVKSPTSALRCILRH
ncbi:MAG: DUF1015 domain-containing protein [Desulfobacterales bacterium]|nr:DUF1015 domain-containing protein [Desulfobacterales bacterium]